MTNVGNLSKSGHGRLRLSVRPASVADSAEISDICLQSLLTSISPTPLKSGLSSGSPLKGRKVGSHYSRKVAGRVLHPALPAEVRALPYLHLPSGFGFVLVESKDDAPDTRNSHFSKSLTISSEEIEKSSSPNLGPSLKKNVHWEMDSDVSDVDTNASSSFSTSSSSSATTLSSYSHSPNSISTTDTSMTNSNSDERIVGYVVGTLHPTQFMREADATWWPAMRLQYPEDLAGTPLDRHFIGLIHKNGGCGCGSGKVMSDCREGDERSGLGKKRYPLNRHPGSTMFGPAQIHLGVLGKYKEHGCDRLLVDVVLRYLRGKTKDQETKVPLS